MPVSSMASSTRVWAGAVAATVSGAAVWADAAGPTPTTSSNAKRTLIRRPVQGCGAAAVMVRGSGCIGSSGRAGHGAFRTFMGFILPPSVKKRNKRLIGPRGRIAAPPDQPVARGHRYQLNWMEKPPVPTKASVSPVRPSKSKPKPSAARPRAKLRPSCHS